MQKDFIFIKLQSGAQLNDKNQVVALVLGKNENFPRIGISHLGFEKKVKKDDFTDFADADAVRLK